MTYERTMSDLLEFWAPVPMDQQVTWEVFDTFFPIPENIAKRITGYRMSFAQQYKNAM